jgi:hypothetical protein
MTARASFTEVIAEVGAGATVNGASRSLGLHPDLVAAMVEEGERLGLLSRYVSTGPSCSGCSGVMRGGCATCPLTHSRPSV